MLLTILLVVHFTAETALRAANFAAGAGDTLVSAVPQAILSVGLAVALVRSLTSGEVVAGRDPSIDGSPSVGS